MRLRTSPPSAVPPGCETIAPLLPLYADGMASPHEMHIVDAHLPGCDDCRESLFWMQATHRALAARPVAVPPAGLQARIAAAIAASSAAPVTLRPATLRPARFFTLRPVYAAAASLTVLGFGLILSYPLLHSPAPSVSVVKPAPPVVAAVPPVSPKTSLVLPHSVRAKPHQVFVARNVPSAAPQHELPKPAAPGHALVLKRTVPADAAAPAEHVASSMPVHAFAPLSVLLKPAAHSAAHSSVVHLPAAPPDKLASTKTSPAENRHPALPEFPSVKPNTQVPMLARHDKEPLPVPVHVEPPTVTEQPATIETASSKIASGGLLAGVGAYAKTMSTVAYGKTSLMERQISRGGTNELHALDTEHFAYLDAIHGRGAP